MKLVYLSGYGLWNAWSVWKNVGSRVLIYIYISFYTWARFKGDLNRRHATCPFDWNGMKICTYIRFSLHFSPCLLKLDIWKSRKYACECCHFVPNSLCQWRHEQGRNMEQKYQTQSQSFLVFVGKEWTCMAASWDAQFDRKRNSFGVNIDTTVKGIHLVWILTQQSKQLIWCEYWHSNQSNSFGVNLDNRIHLVWILTQQSKEFILCE